MNPQDLLVGREIILPLFDIYSNAGHFAIFDTEEDGIAFCELLDEVGAEHKHMAIIRHQDSPDKEYFIEYWD